MMKIFAAALIVATYFASLYAQSGRRISAEPAPRPIAVDESSYSESRSYKPRRIYPRNYDGPKDEQTVTISAKSTEIDEDGEEVISVDASLVKIPVSVYDKNGLYIPNVRKEEVKIFEDGREQEIAYFATTEQPVTVALLLDTSPSTEYKIEEIRAAAKAFVAELKAQDSVIVIEFDGDPQVLTEATTNRTRIYKAIDKADFGHGTALYDAVHVAINKQLSKIEGRKAIVLFTDGVDTTSRKSFGGTLRDAEESGAVIFPIYYNTFLHNSGAGGINGGIIPTTVNRGYGTSAEEYALGKAYLEDLAVSTGGRLFRADSSPGGLTRTFASIAEELRRQYNLGYYPDREGTPGDRRLIKVRIYRPDLIVQARDSYIVGATKTTK